MLLAAGCRVWHAGVLAILAAARNRRPILTSPYRVNRILAYLPIPARCRASATIIQSITAVLRRRRRRAGSATASRFDYLPEDTHGLIFAILCEGFGVAGAVVGAHATIAICGLGIDARAKTPSRGCSGSVVLTLGFRAVMNLTVVTGPR